MRNKIWPIMIISAAVAILLAYDNQQDLEEEF
jgi:hypothetical protein